MVFLLVLREFEKKKRFAIEDLGVNSTPVFSSMWHWDTHFFTSMRLSIRLYKKRTILPHCGVIMRIRIISAERLAHLLVLNEF